MPGPLADVRLGGHPPASDIDHRSGLPPENRTIGLPGDSGTRCAIGQQSYVGLTLAHVSTPLIELGLQDVVLGLHPCQLSPHDPQVALGSLALGRLAG